MAGLVKRFREGPPRPREQRAIVAGPELESGTFQLTAMMLYEHGLHSCSFRHVKRIQVIVHRMCAFFLCAYLPPADRVMLYKQCH